MAKFLVAGHGTIANGVKSAVGILLGNTDNAVFLDTYIDDTEPSDLVADFFQGVGVDEKVIMFADFYGGSVAQVLARWLTRPNTHLIAGFNLAAFLELYAMDDEEITAEEIENVVETSRQLIVYVNKKLEEADPSREEEFF